MNYHNKVVTVAMTSLAMLVPINFARAADASPETAKAVPFIGKAAPVTLLSFFTVNDNRLTYAYEFDGKTPGFPGATAKQSVTLSHFDAWAYGTNLINLSMTKWSQNTPASPCTTPYSGCDGAVSATGLIRSTLGFNEIFDTKAFSIGPLHNVSLEIGAKDYVKNDISEINTRSVVAGLQFQFDLPYKGYLNFAPMFYKAWYYTAFATPAFVEPLGPGIPSGQLDLNPTWTIEVNYYMALGFLPEELPLAVSGRINWTGSMGPFANQSILPTLAPSKSEFDSEPIRLTLDASRMIWGPKYSHLVDVWAAYKYSQNILGLDHTSRACVADTCTISTLYSGITVKF